MPQSGLSIGASGETHRDGNVISSSPLHHDSKTSGKQASNRGEDATSQSSPVFTTSPSECFYLDFGTARYEFRRWQPDLGHVISGPFALDTETTLIDEARPASIPTLVLGMAFDGTHGWFITAVDMPAFLASHTANPLIFHNAAFDLAVLQATHDRRKLQADLYARVEAGRVADTQILARLMSLATLGHGARHESSLGHCAQKY